MTQGSDTLERLVKLLPRGKKDWRALYEEREEVFSRITKEMLEKGKLPGDVRKLLGRKYPHHTAAMWSRFYDEWSSIKTGSTPSQYSVHGREIIMSKSLFEQLLLHIMKKGETGCKALAKSLYKKYGAYTEGTWAWMITEYRREHGGLTPTSQSPRKRKPAKLKAAIPSTTATLQQPCTVIPKTDLAVSPRPTDVITRSITPAQRPLSVPMIADPFTTDQLKEIYREMEEHVRHGMPKAEYIAVLESLRTEKFPSHKRGAIKTYFLQNMLYWERKEGRFDTASSMTSTSSSLGKRSRSETERTQTLPLKAPRPMCPLPSDIIDLSQDHDVKVEVAI